jgi:hypothetical protein
MESLSEFCAKLALIGSAAWNLDPLLHSCHKWQLCNLSNGNHFNYRRMAISQAAVSLACIPDRSDVLVSDRLGALSFRRMVRVAPIP